jgi:hypothetical protein
MCHWQALDESQSLDFSGKAAPAAMIPAWQSTSQKTYAYSLFPHPADTTGCVRLSQKNGCGVIF